MGFWDAIAIRATTSPGTPHETPDLRAPLQRILTSFFLCHFPWIVHCVLHSQSSVGSRGPQIFNMFEKTQCEWLWGHVFVCCWVLGVVFFFHFCLCIMRSVHWLPFCWVFSCERPFDGSHIKETVRFKPKSRWAASSDLAPLPTLPALYVYFSFITRFHSHLIPSNLDLLAAAAALKDVLERGKIIGTKVNTLVEAPRCWREGERKHDSEVTFKQHGH